MRHPTTTSPMPAVLVGDPGPVVLWGAPNGAIRVVNGDGTSTPITSVAEAREAFGEGSSLFHAARIAIEGHPPRSCACGTPINGTYGGSCGDCYRREQVFAALHLAFSRVTDCLALVEARAGMLFVADLADEKTLTGWREVAFGEVVETCRSAIPARRRRAR